MNVSDKTISSSSTSNKPPSIPKGTDENEESYHDKGLNVQNLKKSTATTPAPIKQFMSPTISAASKANPPRKKILAERNDSQDTYPQKTQNFDSKSTQKATNPDSRITSSIEFGDNQENALIDDLSSRPYDPLTNYLSPRPKFLRYKPNRRREILLGQENQVKEGKDDGPLEAKKEIDLPSPCGALAADSTKPNAEQENEESDDSEEEYEELDEERGCWGVRGVVKFFLLMGVLVFSTLYISSMNSPIPSPSVQAVVSVKDGYYMMQDHKNRNARKDSDTIPEPCLDSMRAEKCSSLLADKEDSHIEHPITFANFKSLINSLEEDSKQTHESRAPTFELLGELVVGEMSSSLRSCSRKSRVIESEMSSHSVSVEKGIGSKANSTPVQLQSAFSETSTTNFHSFTNEKKILKKEEEEGGGDGDVKKMVTTTTPLRRSSRLRNRAVSPLIVSAGCYI
ncbi:hypothetical protein RCOM_1488230 [Ricinus communis]|uniref:Uncharacterized protein n=1 Tax=Ricinus communis TaxID=3988 RepID=B9RQD5_RICCO|nr:hypothetical protein RCOM_1488230 [Ricinus communis]